ncbi:tectonin domain-containing protein [Thalassospira tepidiphila]|uniref:tectonin domain-containing protein n=1 Tax=Thalassospira tepidiphila TaxID=393657 RepID=UPI003AA91C93
MAYLVWQSKRYAGIFLAGIFALLFFSHINMAQAQNIQTQRGAITSNALCGAADLFTGELLPACGFEKATKVGQAKGECPPGSFFDVGLWACYTCPEGYNRTGNAVDTNVACSKAVNPPEFLAATRVGSHNRCPAGSETDPRNGGECWKCPDGYGRTWAAVTEWNACGKAFANARSAEFLGSVCPSGTFADPNGGCYSCPENSVRTWEAVSHPRACVRNELLTAANREAPLTCEPGEHFDFVDGGTCWSCPKGSTRSLSDVRSDKACEFLTMRWESTPRTTNGLFAIPGGMEIVADILKTPDAVESVIRRYMEAQKITDESYFTDAMEVIRTEPEQSPALLVAVYERVVKLVTQGYKHPYELDFLTYFATYIQDTRKWTATEMKRSWESWQRGVALRSGSNNMRTNMARLYDVGYRPPSVDTLVDAGVSLAPTAAIALAYTAAVKVESFAPAFQSKAITLAKQILPNTFRDSARYIGIGGRAFSIPFVVVTIASIVTSVAAENAEEMDKQESIVRDAQEIAKRPINLNLMLQQDSTRNELVTNWALMTQEPIKPNPAHWASLMRDIAKASPNVSGTKWVDHDQMARDIAIASDGSVFILSDKLLERQQTMKDGVITIRDVAEEGEASRVMMFNTQSERFEDISGLAAKRIAVAGNILWGINNQGQTFYAYGNSAPYKVNVIQGPKAADIAATDGNVWMLDEQGTLYRLENNRWMRQSGQAASIDVANNGQLWAVNHNKEIWMLDDGKWQRMSGAATDVAVFQSGLSYVVGTDGKIYTYQSDKKNWAANGNKTDAVKVAAGGNQLWRITASGKASQWR